MKKILFSAVLVLAATVVFSSCSKEVSLKDAIIKNQNYEGTDNKKAEWIIQFTEAGYSAVCKNPSLIFSASNWEVVENADKKTGTIKITNVNAMDEGKPTPVGDISGNVTKGGDEMVLTQGSTTITIKKK